MNVKPCNVSQEQRRIINQNIFRSECEKFFGKINRYSLKSNIFLFGKLVDSNGKKGLNEYQVNLIHQGIKTLLAKNQKAETINLINVMYSTIIKRITPDSIISGSVKPETYRQIIDDSIKMYRDYPLSEGIDYRHILGRLVSLKDMSLCVEKKMSRIPEQLSPVAWTINEQLEMVHLLDIISSNYKKVSSDFKIYPDAANHIDHREILNKDEVKNNYHKSILKLLWMLRNSSKKLLGNVANFDDIKHSIELAEYYFNKIPFKDALKMPKLWQVVSEFKKISNTLKKKV